MKFPAEHFEPANMIAVFVRQEHAIELPRRDPALLEPDHDLPRAQSTIDQDPAMIGRDQGAIPRAAAAEHGQSEHARLVADTGAFHKLEMELARKKCVLFCSRCPVGSARAMWAAALAHALRTAKRLQKRVAPRYSSSPAIFLLGNASTRAFFAP